MTEINTFDEPTEFGFTIYSKSNCKYCTYLKELLQSKNFIFKEINADQYLTNDNDKKNFLNFIKELAGKEYKTFPMAFNDGAFIGGFTETKDYITTLLLDFNDIRF